MKLTNFFNKELLEEGYSYMSKSNPQPQQDIVDKFAGVSDSQRSYYIYHWAKDKGMDTDEAMFKAGYVQDGYLGAGAWNWRYVGMGESVQETVPYSKSTEKDLADKIGKASDKKKLKQAQKKSLANYKKKMKANDDWKDTVEEADDEVDTGPTWKDDLEDALDGYPEWAHEYIKDGVCPECGGNGYMDGDYENEDGEENDECNGMYNYDCDEGEIRDNTWADELKSKEPEAPKQPAPSKEQIMKLLPMLHKEYVQSGRYNAFELGGILKQMYPELNKRLAGSYVADFFKTFEEDIDEVAGAQKCWPGYKKDGTQAGTGKNKGKRVNKCVKEENPDGHHHTSNEPFIDPDGPQDEGVYANYVTYVGPNGEQLGTEDYDGELEPDMMAQMASDEECKMLCDKHNMDYNDTVGCLKFDDGEATMQDGEELPDGTIAFYGGKEGSLDDLDEKGPNYDASDIHRGDAITCKPCGGKGCDHCDYKGVHAKDETTQESAPVEFDNDSNEAHVSKMLAKALGDDNKWSEMSAPELYAELESTNPEVADMLHKVAMTIYDVKLKERAYKDVGVADTVKDQRGKEFNFDKSSKKFKSQDGEEADVTTKLGKDLMRQRKNHMKRTSPSYPKNKR